MTSGSSCPFPHAPAEAGAADASPDHSEKQWLINRDETGAVILSGTDYLQNPYPLYRQLAEQGPLHRVLFPSGVHAWLVTGYAAARDALADERLHKDHQHGNDAWRAKASIMPEPQHSRLQGHLLHQDAPKHTVMRKLISPVFSRSRAVAQSASAQAIADELIDALPTSALTGEPPVDAVASFAAIFPFRVLAEAIGLPSDLAGDFRRQWSRVVAPVGPDDPWRNEYARLLAELEAYIDAVIERSREAGAAQSLLTDLVTAEAAGQISENEMRSVIFQLLAAGQEPVTFQISLALLAFFTQPEARERFLSAEPAQREDLIDELMRYDGAFELATWRFFTEDTEFHGQRVPAGDSVIISLAAANRDHRQFPDPGEVDFDRADSRSQLTFGHGVHRCPGTYLARTELNIALSSLLERLPGLALAVPDTTELPWLSAALSRGVTELPVHYDRRLAAAGPEPGGLPDV
ncbi:cytochrome P450 [Acaricomes phytoseiuli]|uniref:cytochrome P450 n=1 Tax=Acaricomes phytoseiuli TaxID=291968 RepID=UPI00036C3483|nr:cytochrome P450 [Acaricomes phytoseiuli]MCW1248607.1 cytochrome P450 [Acaricomes phytoseiuli]